MTKIIEVYSNKVAAQIDVEYMHLTSSFSPSGVKNYKYEKAVLPKLMVSTTPYKSVRERNEAVIRYKMNSINLSDNYFLLLVHHDKTNFATALRKLTGNDAHIISVKVNNILFYKWNKEINIDSTLLNKMNVVYETILKIDREEFKSVLNIINSIIISYSNTGIVSQNDLIWLNKIYSKYKQLGDLYE